MIDRKKYINAITASLLATSVFTSCKWSRDFESKLWKERDDISSFPHRESMLHDIIENKRLNRLKYGEVIDSLGEPDFIGEHALTIGYSIVVDYGMDIDPVYTKNLIINFERDSTIRKIEINEWKK